MSRTSDDERRHLRLGYRDAEQLAPPAPSSPTIGLNWILILILNTVPSSLESYFLASRHLAQPQNQQHNEAHLRAGKFDMHKREADLVATLFTMSRGSTGGRSSTRRNWTAAAATAAAWASWIPSATSVSTAASTTPSTRRRREKDQETWQLTPSGRWWWTASSPS